MASDPRFLGEVVASVGHMVIPVVETFEGELIQDTSAIIDHREARFPDRNCSRPAVCSTSFR